MLYGGEQCEEMVRSNLQHDASSGNHQNEETQEEEIVTEGMGENNILEETTWRFQRTMRWNQETL